MQKLITYLKYLVSRLCCRFTSIFSNPTFRTEYKFWVIQLMPLLFFELFKRSLGWFKSHCLVNHALDRVLNAWKSFFRLCTFFDLLFPFIQISSMTQVTSIHNSLETSLCSNQTIIQLVFKRLHGIPWTKVQITCPTKLNISLSKLSLQFLLDNSFYSTSHSSYIGYWVFIVIVHHFNKIFIMNVMFNQY